MSGQQSVDKPWPLVRRCAFLCIYIYIYIYIEAYSNFIAHFELILGITFQFETKSFVINFQYVGEQNEGGLEHKITACN